jgi:hypothetical protein
MPSEERDRRNGDSQPKSWAQWRQEVFESIEELDRACARARQVIYGLRPLVRPKSQETTEEEERTRRDQRQVASFNNRRRRGARER